MPAISKVRTPMRLLAMPSRMPFFGSLCFANISLSVSASVSMSRSSPPTTTPSGERCARDLVQLRRAAVVGDARGSDLRRADLEADDPGLRDLLLLLTQLFGGLGLLSPLAAAFGSFRLAIELQLALPDRRLLFLRLADGRRLGRLLRRTAELQLALPDWRLLLFRLASAPLPPSVPWRLSVPSASSAFACLRLLRPLCRAAEARAPSSKTAPLPPRPQAQLASARPAGGRHDDGVEIDRRAGIDSANGTRTGGGPETGGAAIAGISSGRSFGSNDVVSHAVVAPRTAEARSARRLIASAPESPVVPQRFPPRRRAASTAGVLRLEDVGLDRGSDLTALDRAPRPYFGLRPKEISFFQNESDTGG